MPSSGPGIESSLVVGDWHADSRLCDLSPNDLAARGMVPNVPGNQWRVNSELARTTAVLPRPTVPYPAELLHVTDSSVQDPFVFVKADSKLNKEDKAAQRGPHVAQAYLEGLFSKAATPSNEAAMGQSWLQPGEETWILDLTAWVGDRAMASLNLMDDAHSKYGILRHVLVDPVRHSLHAREPMAIVKDNISLKKGIPMKVLWINHGDVHLPKPAVDPNPQVPPMPIES